MNYPISRFYLHKTYWLLIIILISHILVSVNANVNYTNSDPKATILLSDSIITKQSFKLDHYGSQILQEYGWLVQEVNGHMYHFFPIGSSIFSTPFVLVAKILGIDVLKNQEVLQRVISTIVGLLTIIVFFRISLLTHPPLESAMVVAVIWFGSSLITTSVTALWSHNFGVLFSSIVILKCISTIQKGLSWPTFSIGALIFGAYLCRPTFAVFALFVILYIFSYNRIAAVKTFVVLTTFVIGFSVWSLITTGEYIPSYYVPSRLSSNQWYVAIVGNLISPSRGVLFFSPFLLLILMKWRQCDSVIFRNRSWMLLGILWPIAHTWMISSFSHWWAGHSYGARFMTDATPGILLLLLRWWPRFTELFNRKLTISAILITSCVSIAINSGQGVFNKFTSRWNSDPNIDFYQFYLFDFRFPQFLYSEKNHRLRTQNHQLRPRISIHNSSTREVSWYGWSHSEETHRWSSSEVASIEFTPNNPAIKLGYLLLDANYFGNQHIIVQLNGKTIGDYHAKGFTHPRMLKFDPGELKIGVKNSLSFRLPDSKFASAKDKRKIALALRTLEIF